MRYLYEPYKINEQWEDHICLSVHVILLKSLIQIELLTNRSVEVADITSLLDLIISGNGEHLAQEKYAIPCYMLPVSSCHLN
jgi:hypothetical protein